MNVGIIGVFARHPTAANLLMILMVISGFFALNRMNTQFFPDFGIDIVLVSVEWPGASAEDVDTNIVQAIEPEVRFLDSVKRVRSSSVEGRATILVEFNAGTDMQAALSDVEPAVSLSRRCLTMRNSLKSERLFATTQSVDLFCPVPFPRRR